MKCPRCGDKLTSEKYEGVDIERCTACKGFWLPGYRLADVIEIREKTFNIEEVAKFRELHEAHASMVHQADKEINCPECNQVMTQNHYNYAAEVLIDRCPAGHGVWLDPGEIEHIQMAVEEEEGELQAIVADKQLKLDNFTSQQLENERRKYSFNIWHFFCWGRGHG